MKNLKKIYEKSHSEIKENRNVNLNEAKVAENIYSDISKNSFDSFTKFTKIFEKMIGTFYKESISSKNSTPINFDKFYSKFDVKEIFLN